MLPEQIYLKLQIFANSMQAKVDLFDGPTVDGDLKNVTDVLENNKCSLQEWKEKNMGKQNFSHWSNLTEMNLPRVHFHLYAAFSHKHYNFCNNLMCTKYPFSKRYWDSNPQPFDHESPPITTRPGLPPLFNWKLITNSYSILGLYKVGGFIDSTRLFRTSTRLSSPEHVWPKKVFRSEPKSSKWNWNNSGPFLKGINESVYFIC